MLFLCRHQNTLSHLFRTEMKNFTKKFSILKSTSVSYVRNTLISLSNIVEKCKNKFTNVKKSLHFTVKNQRNFEFSEKKYKKGPTISVDLLGFISVRRI